VLDLSLVQRGDLGLGAQQVALGGPELPLELHHGRGQARGDVIAEVAGLGDRCDQVGPLARDVVQELGIEPERVEMFNLSAGEGPRFAEIAREMVERAKALGPSPVKMKKAA
jgi:hypothetical protein